MACPEVVIQGKNVILRANGTEMWRFTCDYNAKPTLARLSRRGNFIACVERFYEIMNVHEDHRATIRYCDTVVVLNAATGRLTTRLHHCDVVTDLAWFDDDPCQNEKLVVTHLEPIFDGADSGNQSVFDALENGWLRSVHTWQGYLRRDLPSREFLLEPLKDFSFKAIERRVFEEHGL